MTPLSDDPVSWTQGPPGAEAPHYFSLASDGWVRASLSRTAPLLPSVCPACLAPNPTDSLVLSADITKRNYIVATLEETYQIRIPYCRRCAASIRAGFNRKAWAGFLTGLPVAVICLLAGVRSSALFLFAGTAGFLTSLVVRPTVKPAVRMDGISATEVLLACRSREYGNATRQANGQEGIPESA